MAAGIPPAKSQKDKLVAEAKVNAARTESIAIKNKPVEVVAEVAPEVVAEVTPEVAAETPAAE
ncbi:MAG: hypothetical protein EAZ27_02035 [Cytophagales bacterium]|nr:MAG: hypothetical protein EAZ27_02035 [Cytophagales bacterium]